MCAPRGRAALPSALGAFQRHHQRDRARRPIHLRQPESARGSGLRARGASREARGRDRSHARCVALRGSPGDGSGHPPEGSGAVSEDLAGSPKGRYQALVRDRRAHLSKLGGRAVRDLRVARRHRAGRGGGGAPRARGADAAGAETREPRRPGGRDRSRLQQSARRYPLECGNCGRGSRAGISRSLASRGDQAGK